jgi:hypothetical protein
LVLVQLPLVLLQDLSQEGELFLSGRLLLAKSSRLSQLAGAALLHALLATSLLFAASGLSRCLALGARRCALGASLVVLMCGLMSHVLVSVFLTRLAHGILRARHH